MLDHKMTALIQTAMPPFCFDVSLQNTAVQSRPVSMGNHYKHQQKWQKQTRSLAIVYCILYHMDIFKFILSLVNTTRIHIYVAIYNLYLQYTISGIKKYCYRNFCILGSGNYYYSPLKDGIFHTVSGMVSDSFNIACCLKGHIIWKVEYTAIKHPKLIIFHIQQTSTM